jgi:intein/homing endonuclease
MKRNIHHNFTLPQKSIVSMLNISNMRENSDYLVNTIDEIQFSKYDKERDIRIPKIKSEKLAEFFGILSGDGYLLIKGRIHRFGITLNLTEDEKYRHYVISLVNELFDVFPSTLIRVYQNTFEIFINSKAITGFIKSLGFPNGIKMNKLQIPPWILRRKKFIRRFLRGLFDTDGCLFFAKRGTYKLNEYPVIEIKSYDKYFISSVAEALKIIGFKPLLQKDRIQFNGKKWLEKWKKQIEFKNLNSISRYLIWKKFNYCPPNTDLNFRLDMLSQISRVGRTAMRPISNESRRCRTGILIE